MLEERRFPNGAPLTRIVENGTFLDNTEFTPSIGVTAYFSPSWKAFQADRGRDFSVIVDGVSV